MFLVVTIVGNVKKMENVKNAFKDILSKIVCVSNVVKMCAHVKPCQYLKSTISLKRMEEKSSTLTLLL